MTKISEAQIKKIGKLARISLSKEEAHDFSDNITEIVTWIDSLNKVNTDDIEPLLALEHNLQMRDDEIKGDDISEDILANAPKRKLDFFAVPKFVE